MCNACPPITPYPTQATGVPFYFIVVNWNGTVLKDKHGKFAHYHNSYDAEARIYEEMKAGKIGEYTIYKSWGDAKPVGNFTMLFHY